MRDGHFYKFGETGSPDIFVVHNSKIYGIEVKNERGRQSDSQRTWQDNFTKSGGIYILARNLDDVLQKL